MSKMHYAKWMLRSVVFTVGIGGYGAGYANEFFTIIGPDGRPMVVQQKRVEKKLEKETSRQDSISTIENKQQQQQQKVEQDQRSSQSIKQDPLHTTQQRTELVIAVERSQQQIVPLHNQPKSFEKNQTDQSKSPIKKITTETAENNRSKPSTDTFVESPSAVVPVQQRRDQSTTNPSTDASKVTASTSGKITKIDGVEYVDNEFLEDKEFNLEGRKRFYVMPDGSTAGGRFETIEREKGITKSLLAKFSNNGMDEHKTIVLAPSYHRLAKDDLVKTLEQSCFAGKKLDKAKTLGQKNPDMGFWPVAPFKEKFVYEVVKFDPNVKNLQLSSFASTQKAPTYYWPLVVFLDQQGCVVEGVSGFKNQDINPNKFQHSALEGVLKVPLNAVYMMMTPLAESIDVPELKLSNQGQIKLSVLF